MILIAAAAAALFSTAPARGQLVISSGYNDGSVIIDQSVLDALGPPRTLPQLLGPEISPPVTMPPVQLKEPKAPSTRAAAPAPAKQKTTPAQPRAKQPAQRKTASKAAKPAAVPAAAPAEPPKATATADTSAGTSPQQPQNTPSSASDEQPRILPAAAASGIAASQELLTAPAASDAASPAPDAPRAEPQAVDAAPATPEAEDAAEPTATSDATAPAPGLEETSAASAGAPADAAADARVPPPLPLTAAATTAAVDLPAATPSSTVAPRGLVPPPPVPAIPAIASRPPQPQVVPASASGLAANPGVVERNGHMSVLFSTDETDLPNDARSALEALAQRMDKDPSLYLQLVSYAEGSESDASKARRLSLSRALAVRSYLMNYGLRSSRIDVRALGNKAPDEPLDRVDLVVEKR